MTRVLVVDDNEQNRYLLHVLLAGNGYEVELAADGVEALTLARDNPPDLVITDILMPQMDGYTLCPSLETRRSTERGSPGVLHRYLHRSQGRAARPEHRSGPFRPQTAGTRHSAGDSREDYQRAEGGWERSRPPTPCRKRPSTSRNTTKHSSGSSKTSSWNSNPPKPRWNARS